MGRYYFRSSTTINTITAFVQYVFVWPISCKNNHFVNYADNTTLHFAGSTKAEVLEKFLEN